MAPPKSKVWNHFSKKSKSSVQCNKCGKILKSSGNTSNLGAHLRQKHPSIFKAEFETSDTEIRKTEKNLEVASSSVMKEGEEGNFSTIDEPQSSTCVEESIPPKDIPLTKELPIATTSSATGLLKSGSFSQSQPTIKKALKSIASFSEGGPSNVKITDAITYFLCKDNLPFSTVEGEGFLKLFKEVTPLYKVPTRNTFKKIIDRKYEIISTAFKETLKLVNHVTLTSDIWTDMQMKSFLSVTIHYIINVKQASASLGVIELSESHTAQYISLELLKLLEDWGLNIENVVAVVTDNGANIVKAVYNTFGRNKHVPCFAHTLNLVCESSIKNSEGLNELLQKVRSIITWCKRSVHACDKLRKQQLDTGIPEGSVKKLILDVKTRWNSTFYMIQRFVEMAHLIANTIFENLNAPPMVTAIEISQLKEIIQLLNPLEKMTTEISGEQYITISKVIPMLRCVLEQYYTKFNHLSTELAQNLKAALLAEFDKRFGQIEKSHILATATILDPRFKQIHFKDPLACSNTISHLRRQIAANSEEFIDSADTPMKMSLMMIEMNLLIYGITINS